ncbi:hypothetical protein [Companilactobacillus ginsenosidimutans]|uniref:Membrane protein 6-pyruvoyl-tetrahydropterin synthase-related domain-containing protein n=1 Tax=Companilactobacillus ginsenosidimutans TaxID=1007676 RepID=A0A0H4QIM9_9LACO|nr:hypothetical protein [Companilactobacillus ginsenosidimutans]AKP67797.1 hypothetical protein ABM34_09805 [Companilactobacillus ginsenosidimutans]
MNTREKYLVVITDILLLALLTYPIFLGGLVGGYDPGFHMGRIQMLASNISAGHFPNPIGYEYLDKFGYGIGFFYGNFLMYPFAMLKVLGLSTYKAYIVFIFTFVALAIFSINFATQKLFHNSWATILSAPIYLTSYYFVSIIYIRAAAGELMAFALIPWILLSTFKMVQGETKYWPVFAVAFSLLLVSHVLSFLISVVTAGLIVIMNIIPVFKNRKILFSFIKGTLLFLGLSAVFLIPFVQQYTVQPYNSTAVDQYGNYLIIVYSVWMKNHVFDPTQFVQTMGLWLVILIIFALLYYLFKQIRSKSFHIKNKIIPQSFIIIAIYASLIVSPNLLQFAIKEFKPLVLLQVMTRVSVMIIPLFALLIAFALGDMIKNWGKFRLPLVAIFFAFIAIVTINNPIKSNLEQVGARKQPIPVGSISMGEYEPAAFMKYMTQHGFTVDQKFLEKNQDVDITENTHNEAVVKIDHNKSSRKVMLPRLYYKGYQVKTVYDGKSITKPAARMNGLVATKLPADFKSGKVIVTYQNTPESIAGWWITILTVVFMAVLLIWKFKKELSEIHME